jgi:pimeloyl-ACP methyl ester carboxylesterase
MPNQSYPDYYVSSTGYRALMAWYERALGRITVPYESLYLPTRYGSTHVIAAGDRGAYPIFMLHGINTNAAVWRPQINFFSQSYRVYVPDVVGFVGKSAPIRLPYDDSYGVWAVDVLNALGIEQTHVIGSSAGGHFVLKLAAYAPQRVRAIILMNPCGIAPYRFPFNLSDIPGSVTAFNWLNNNFCASPALARAMVRRGTAPSLPLDAERVEFSYLVLKYYRRHEPPGLLRDEELRRVITPSLLLLSEYEVFSEPIRVIQRVDSLLPNLIAAEIVANAGHDMNIDQPIVVNNRLIKFFQDEQQRKDAMGIEALI